MTTLDRPEGLAELDHKRVSGFRKFPPRLPEQPIFYPVLTEAYATQIARHWNTKDERSGFVGYVLRFQVRTEFLRNYDVHVSKMGGIANTGFLLRTWHDSTRTLRERLK